MMRNIAVELNMEPMPDKLETEIVERKGQGHPDTLIDGIMEEISVGLSYAYLKECGVILHHNVDKGLIIGGRSKPEFNGGKLLYPIQVILAGRATASYSGHGIERDIPVHSIALATARKYLKEHTRFLDIDSQVVFDSKILEGSADLKGVCDHEQAMPLANDTSFGIGFAPFTDSENLTIEVEKFLNSKQFKSASPWVGEDIKVMTLRENGKIRITIACAFVDRFVSSPEDYFDKKSKLREEVLAFASKRTKLELEVNVNTGDDKAKGIHYLTVTGLSCEMGDDGSVGRGNRINGLITPLRSMTLEAAAGKNPINHVGKIYSFAATEIASLIVKENSDVEGCTIALLSEIGKPIDKPKIAHIRLNTQASLESLKPKIMSSVDSYLADIKGITQRILEKKGGSCY